MASPDIMVHRCGKARPVAAGTKVARLPWRTIDVHCHIFTPAVEALVADRPEHADQRMKDAAAIGDASNRVNAGLLGALVPKLTTIDARLADMDAMGVDVQLISPSPTQYHSWADVDLAAEITRLQNDRIADLCEAVPARFAGLGTVALQHPEIAAREVRELVGGRGFKGVQISSLVNGADIADAAFLPFWEAAAETGAVVFIHPWGTTLGTRLSRHYLMNTIGQPFETTVCLSKLIFGGMLERLSGLRILAAHGGGYLPSYLGRSDHAHAVRPELGACTCAPSGQLRRLWFDSLVYDPAQLARLIDQVGDDRVLLGTDYPFDMGHYDPAAMVGDLTADQQRRVLGTNAEALLGLGASGKYEDKACEIEVER